MQVRDIDPERFERLAKKADKYIQEAAEKARSGSVAGAKASSPADVARLQTYELARDVNRAKAAKLRRSRPSWTTLRICPSRPVTRSCARSSPRRRAAPPPLRRAHRGDECEQDQAGLGHRPQRGGGCGLAHTPSRPRPRTTPTRRCGVSRRRQQWMEESARPPCPPRSSSRSSSRTRSRGESLRPAEARAIADAVKQLTSRRPRGDIVRRKDAEATVAEAVEEISAASCGRTRARAFRSRAACPLRGGATCS
jgi:hypothetical protein